MGVCYIVGAGEFYGSFTPTDDDLVIAADGGYEALVARGIRCDVLIGDMDSIKNLPSGITARRFNSEKDETDTYLAYLEGKERGYESFAIYGGVGGRSDHTYANYSLLLHVRENGGRATLYGDGEISYVLKNERMRVTGEPEKRISVFAIGKDAKKVDIKGLYYEMSDGVLLTSFPLGVSNRFVTRTAELGVLDGALLVIQEI